MADNDEEKMISTDRLLFVQIPLWPIMTVCPLRLVQAVHSVQIPLWPIMTGREDNYADDRNLFRFLYGR